MARKISYLCGSYPYPRGHGPGAAACAQDRVRPQRSAWAPALTALSRTGVITQGSRLLKIFPHARSGYLHAAMTSPPETLAARPSPPHGVLRLPRGRRASSIRHGGSAKRSGRGNRRRAPAAMRPLVRDPTRIGPPGRDGGRIPGGGDIVETPGYRRSRCGVVSARPLHPPGPGRAGLAPVTDLCCLGFLPPRARWGAQGTLRPILSGDVNGGWPAPRSRERFNNAFGASFTPYGPAAILTPRVCGFLKYWTIAALDARAQRRLRGIIDHGTVGRR